MSGMEVSAKSKTGGSQPTAEATPAFDPYDAERMIDPNAQMPALDIQKAAEQLQQLLLRYNSKPSGDPDGHEARIQINALLHAAKAEHKELELAAEFDRQFEAAAKSSYAEKGRDLPLLSPLQSSHAILAKPIVSDNLAKLLGAERWAALQSEAAARHEAMQARLNSIRDKRRAEIHSKLYPSPSPSLTPLPNE